VRARLAPCPADPCRTVDEFGDGRAENWRQVRALVATRWLIPSGTVRRLYSEQPVELGMDIQDRVLVIMAAGQEYPGALLSFERDDYA
jgi:hypothetical protein